MSIQPPATPDPEPLSPERLAQIRERAEDATSGPWAVEENSEDLNRWVVSVTADSTLQANLGYVGNSNRCDAEFIAHAPTDVRDLLAEVDRLRAEAANSRTAVLRDASARLGQQPFAADSPPEFWKGIRASRGFLDSLAEEAAGGDPS